MTRETKIGLLVGLAFIIVIGILLEDHFSSVAEPKPAPLSVAGPNVRSGYGSPGSASAGQSVPTAPTMEPRGMVPSPAELNARRDVNNGNTSGRDDQQGYSEVRVGPAGANDNATTRRPTRDIPPTTVTPSVPLAGGAIPMATDATPRNNPRNPSVGTDPRLADLAQRVGEPLEPIGTPRTDARDANVAVNVRECKAEPGDNLSKLTRKYMGADSKANREAFLKANPDLAADPKQWIVAGKTYVVPQVAAAAPMAPTATPQSQIPPVVEVRPAPAAQTPQVQPQAPAAGESWYTTKPGDSLWRIATDQCGTGGAVAAIKQLNPDKFPNNTDVVQPNVKLRLPAKQVASGT